jgi:hypothetical protein
MPGEAWLIDGQKPSYADGARVRAVGMWSPQPPPYLSAISEREFASLKEECLKRTMMVASLLPSYRVIAYFLVDSLNWATMDCWPRHDTLAGLAGPSLKTVQRSILIMEETNLLAVYRRRASSHPLRYAPNYLIRKTEDTAVPHFGHRCPRKVDARVHQSFLSTLSESSLASCRPEQQRPVGDDNPRPLSFDRAQRGRLESQVAALLGGFEVLFRLATIHDDIITRLCEAHQTGHLGERQIRAAKLAAKQSQSR